VLTYVDELDMVQVGYGDVVRLPVLSNKLSDGRVAFALDLKPLRAGTTVLYRQYSPLILV
jgi:hypothetical protein